MTDADIDAIAIATDMGNVAWYSFEPAKYWRSFARALIAAQAAAPATQPPAQPQGATVHLGRGPAGEVIEVDPPAPAQPVTRQQIHDEIVQQVGHDYWTPYTAQPVQAEPKRYLYQWADGHEALEHSFRNGAYPTKVTPLYTAPPAAPAAQPELMAWDEAQRICDLPAVHEAMRNLLDDNTGDNATCLVREILLAAAPAAQPEPVNMILHCPNCGAQHIDAPSDELAKIAAAELGLMHGSREWEDYIEKNAWDNPPHRSHLCGYCGHTWRPADVPTNGVAAVTTRGKADSKLVKPSVFHFRMTANSKKD